MQGSGTEELTGILGEVNFESGSAEEFRITPKNPRILYDIAHSIPMPS